MVFDAINADQKDWMVAREYGLASSSLPKSGRTFPLASTDESDAILDYFDAYPLNRDEKLCVDITGFLRPQLLFLLGYLFRSGISSVEMLYSEPVAYQQGSATKFASGASEIRQVCGYQGSHTPDSEGEYLIVGCGYDAAMMTAIANFRLQATKIQLFPFPALRPHMYQENRLRTEECVTAFGRVQEQIFAPGHDPFATAHVLANVCRSLKGSINNLYLAPLATKPQVLGFGLFYLMDCAGGPVSIINPVISGYNEKTSVGLSEIWRYVVDFELMRNLSSPGWDA